MKFVYSELIFDITRTALSTQFWQLLTQLIFRISPLVNRHSILGLFNPRLSFSLSYVLRRVVILG